VVSGILALISSQLLSEPLLPEHFEDETQDKKMRSLFVNQDFILIVIGMFAGTFAGLMIIGNLKQIMLMSGIEDSAATLCITLFAVGNISGRVIWGQITDKLQPWPTIVLANAFFALSLLILLVTENNAPMLLLASLAIGAGFGSCFVIYASAISKIFGIRFFARLYPLCFGAYGIAALTGPLAGGWLADYTGSFKTGILVSMKMLIVLIIFVVVVQNWERIPSARRRKTANA
jgi:OFA family oxalate/formate antiporter-like MFS transporter